MTGFPYLIAVINLPQRFQIVNRETPLMAGVHLLPLLCSMAFGKRETSTVIDLDQTLIGYLDRRGGWWRDLYQEEPDFTYSDCRILSDSAGLRTHVHSLRQSHYRQGHVRLPVHPRPRNRPNFLFSYDDGQPGQ